MARWNHSEPFPNSVVKRCCGDDSCRVADRQNSSMPGFYYTKPKPPTTLGGFAFYGSSGLRQLAQGEGGL